MFNVGNYRRKINSAVAMHDFFDDKRGRYGGSSQKQYVLFSYIQTPTHQHQHHSTRNGRYETLSSAGKDLDVAIYDTLTRLENDDPGLSRSSTLLEKNRKSSLSKVSVMMIVVGRTSNVSRSRCPITKVWTVTVLKFQETYRSLR